MRTALLLGSVQGPTELLPVSSSAHLAIVPWLLGSDYARLDDELRKSFEVAVHAGTALALALALRRDVARAVRTIDASLIGFLLAATAPAAAVGYAFERPIEARLGRPASMAAGLAAGALAMLLADRAPRSRAFADAGVADGAWLGVAQACALVPGVSRSGATLAAARARGFARADASRLSRQAALPVIGGAAALKALRLWRRGLPAEVAGALAGAAAAAFAATLAARPLLRAVEADRPLAPFAFYRLALAAAIVVRLRRDAGGVARGVASEPGRTAPAR